MDYQLYPLSGGHSGAELYRLAVSDSDSPAASSVPDRFSNLDLSNLPAGNYCLKILHPCLGNKHLRQIHDICAVYQSLDIPALRLLQSGPTPDGRHYCIYNYIDGENFETVGECLSLADNYRVGLQVGTWLRRLKSAPVPASLQDTTPDLDAMTAEADGYYRSLRACPATESLFHEFFSSDLIDSIPARLGQTQPAFRNLKPCLIHGDIKRSNLMRSHSGHIFLIDLESMRQSYDFLNFRYQMTWMLSSDSATKPEFNRGLFDGLYRHSRPAHFQDQLVYVLLFNFLEHAAKHLDNLDEIQYFFRRLQPVLPKALNSTVLMI